MPVLRRILPRAAVPAAVALLLGVPAAAAAHASARPAPPASGAVIEVAASGSPAASAAGGARSPDLYSVGSVYTAQALAGQPAART